MDSEKQKQAILEYLENAYTGARAADDLEIMCRLSRAIIAFSCDDLFAEPDWNKMVQSFLEK